MFHYSRVLCGLWLPLLVAPSAEVLFFVIFCGFCGPVPDAGQSVIV